jgi:hypothetical protein
MFPPPLSDEEQEHGGFIGGIPGYVLTMGLGLMALSLSGAAFLPDLIVLAYADLPVALVCFLVSSIVCMGSKRHRGLAFTGVLFSVIALVASAMHLLLYHDHPWFWR